MTLLTTLLAFLVALTPTTGIVRDATTDIPLAGVVVQIVGDAGAPVVTDSAGRFTIDLSEPVRLRFTRLGYAAAEVAATPGATVVVALRPAPQALEGVTVTALRGDESAPLSQTRRSQADLERAYSGQEMPLMLAKLPSITATSDAGSESGYTYFRLRGLDQTRLNVTLDGVPLNEPEDQGIFFSNFPDFANSIRSVQVQRGVGTSSYGTASYAGAVNFESVALAASRRGGEVQITGGSYDTRRVSLEYATGLRATGFAGYARLSGQTTDGYRRHSGNRSGSAFLSGGYFGARHVWKATLLTGHARNDMAYLAAPIAGLEADRRANPLGSDERDRFGQHFLTLSHTAALGAFTTLATTAYHVRSQGDYDVRVPPDLYNFNLGSVWTGLLTTAHAERGALTIDAGAHASTYRREHWSAIRPDRDVRLYTNAGRKEEASTFAKASVDAGHVTLVADLQLRVARFAYKPDPDAGVSPESIHWGFVNPKAGVTVRATPRVAFYGSLGWTGREPTRNDMFAGFDNLDTSNLDFVGPFDRVRPEYVADLEAGMTMETPLASVRANGFWMDFRDEITPVGQLSYLGLPLRKNVDRSTRRGLELDATLRGIRRVSGSISGAVTYARIRAYTDDASGVTYRNVEPLLTPRITAAHDLRFTMTRLLSVTAGGRYASRSFLANTGDRRFILPAAYISDLGVRAGTDRRSLQLIVYNVGDSDRYSGGYTDGATSYYYVHAARHAMLTARIGF
jgi:iron complex outermembrane recepter protein